MEIGEIKEEKRLSSNKRIKILGVSVDILSMNETVRIVDEYIRTKTPLHLMGVNADKLNECEDNPLMKKIVNSCGIINADGASVVLASKRLFKDDALSERVAGIDLMMELVKLSSERGYRVYLLGARKQIVEETKKELVKTFPNVKIVGIHDGYFKEEEWANVSEEIRKARPDIVFVGRKKVIFVNGCFWHHHSCKFFVWPKTHSTFWKNKIDKNVDRDAANISNLKNMGWDVLVIWECELKNDIQNVFLKKVVPFLE